MLIDPSSPHLRQNKAERVIDLESLGAEALEVVLDTRESSRGLSVLDRLVGLIRPKVVDYYRWAGVASVMGDILVKTAPDAIFVYEVAALASMYGLQTPPVLIALVDLDHLPNLYRLAYSRPRLDRSYFASVVSTLLGAKARRDLMLSLLRECDVVVDFAAHHAAWLRANGIPQCGYMPTPVFDAGGPEWFSRRMQYGSREKARILMIGHLRGTATVTGLELFARKILPVLEEQLGCDTFEVHIVGGFADTLSHRLRGMLFKPWVKFRGHVEPADEEFLSADVLLVPTPIKLGARVRIIVGYSFGCCVVAHAANKLGIPEMIHGENALLADDGYGLALAVIEAVKDRELRVRLGERGRRTYETHFAPSVVGARIVAELEQLGDGRHHRPARQ
ncbi:MAG: glycosyltransferase [Candidatus Methylomirabilales bacterium]